MATAHIESKLEEIAPVVLMPGDPLRAKYIADNFLDDAKLINTVRNMFGYTGTYKGKKVTVFASGMGVPSIGIYSYELYKFYNVEKIIRVGTAGAYTKDLNLYDIVLVNGCYSESSYAKTQSGCEDDILYADDTLNFNIRQTAEENNIPITLANVHSSDVFYKKEDNFEELYKKIRMYVCRNGIIRIIRKRQLIK